VRKREGSNPSVGIILKKNAEAIHPDHLGERCHYCCGQHPE